MGSPPTAYAPGTYAVGGLPVLKSVAEKPPCHHPSSSGGMMVCPWSALLDTASRLISLMVLRAAMREQNCCAAVGEAMHHLKLGR